MTGPSPCSSISAALTSAVVPGVLSTMAVACCVSALSSVDLPAFISPKRPMSGRATCGGGAPLLVGVGVVVEEEENRDRWLVLLMRGKASGDEPCVCVGCWESVWGLWTALTSTTTRGGGGCSGIRKKRAGAAAFGIPPPTAAGARAPRPFPVAVCRSDGVGGVWWVGCVVGFRTCDVTARHAGAIADLC